jgi:hypothetical protein
MLPTGGGWDIAADQTPARNRKKMIMGPDTLKSRSLLACRPD